MTRMLLVGVFRSVIPLSLDMHDSYTVSMKIINDQNLSDYQSSTVNNLRTLIEMRSGNNFVNGFTLNEINQMIEIIATD